MKQSLSLLRIYNVDSKQSKAYVVLFVFHQTVRESSISSPVIFNLFSRVQRIFEPSSCSSRHFNLIYSS